MRIEEAIDAALRDRADLGRGDGEEIGAEGERLAVEVAVGLDVAALQHDGIVDGRGQLDRGRPANEVESVARRACDLGAAAHRVRVLDRVLGMAMRGHDLRALHQTREVGRAGQLARVRAHLVQVRLERAVGAEKRFGRHRGGDVGRPEQPLRVRAREHQHAKHAVRAVDQREAFLGLEPHRFQLRGLERLSRRLAPAFLVQHLALTHQREADVGQGSQVAAAADRSVARDDRSNAGVEQGDERVGDERAHSRHAHRERAGTEQHRGPDDLGLHRRADSRRVGADQGKLQLGLAQRCHPGAGQGSEAGRDSVDRIARAGRALDTGTAALHLLSRAGRQRDLLTLAGDGHDLVFGQTWAAEGDRHRSQPKCSSELRACSGHSVAFHARAHTGRPLWGSSTRTGAGPTRSPCG